MTPAHFGSDSPAALNKHSETQHQEVTTRMHSNPFGVVIKIIFLKVELRELLALLPCMSTYNLQKRIVAK